MPVLASSWRLSGAGGGVKKERKSHLVKHCALRREKDFV
jgi:hypothetical protein